MTYLVTKSAPLLLKNADHWIEALSNVTKDTLQPPTPGLFE